MKNLYIIALFFTLANPIWGQNYRLMSGSVPNESAIELKWLTKEIKLDAAYDIYRSDAGQNNWKKINETPIRRATALSKSELDAVKKLDGNQGMVIYSLAMNDDSLDKKMNLGFLMINAITNNDLAKACGIYYRDNLINTSQAYDYKLAISGGTSSLSTIQNIRYQSDYIPQSVLGFTGKSGNKTAVFDWTYNDNHPIYKIYRGTRAGAYDTFFMIMPSEANIKSTGINKLNYRDNLKGLRPGSTYYYAAAAMDFFGREGQKSSEVSIRIQDLSPPPMIQGIRASFEKDDAIYLRWRKPHPSITSLKIYRSNQRSTGYSVIANPVDSFYIDKSFDRKSNYYFVEATNDNNISSFTDTITCIPPDFDPPATPMNFRATADTGNIYLSWDANTESDLAGYLIFKALSTDSQNFSPIFPEAIRSNSYTDREPKEAGNFLIYKICAMDKSYNRSAVSASIAVRMPNIVAPKPSTIVELENENGEVQLSWTPNREPDFMRYDVYRGTPVDDSTFGDYKLVATTRETSYRDKTNEQNKTYSYYIRVLDSSNNFSNSPPRIVQANRPKNAEAIQNFNVSATENSIRIVWRSGSQNVQLFRKTQTNYYAITPVAQFEKFEDKDVSKGNAYSYKIVSYGEENQVQSEEKRIEF